MDEARREGLRIIANGLRFYGSAPSYERARRLMGVLSELDAWETIDEAERIGLIEPDEMPVSPTRLSKRWRLAKGFDMARLGIRA